MINKDSLLDAYLSLSGSPMTHLGLLITILIEVESPGQIKDDELRGTLDLIYISAIIVHGISLVVQTLANFDKLHMYKVMQISETAIVFANIYLLLNCIETFASLQQVDVLSADNLNPNVTFIDKKFDQMTEAEK